MPYPLLREILKPYAQDYACTDSLLQEGRELAKAQLFGRAEDNVKYARAVEMELRSLGHHVKCLFAERKQVIQELSSVVLQEEKTRLKRLKQAMDREMQLQFVQRWKKENEIVLNEVFGMADAMLNQKTYLKGILFAPSTSSHIVPLLQDLIQCDGAHSQFGKYTLYSAYGTNANGHMSPVAFGLLFGNEDKKNWTTFWSFVKSVHPSVDSPEKTFVTDQDKGSILAFNDVFEHASQFMCSFHRRQNILKTCGGGKKGLVPYSAMWVFNILHACNSINQLNRCKEKYYDKMHPTDIHYLQSLPDECQYPAARCAMGDGISMYSKSASSGVESMNNANSPVHQRTAVDILVAVMLLLDLEGERFRRYKELAWEREDQLTDKGMRLMEECFEGVEVRDYIMSAVSIDHGHRITVKKSTVNASSFTVVIPSEGHLGSRFGTCTCGKPATYGIPCDHMVVVAKSCVIEGLSRIQIMPYWLTTAHWRAQYPLELDCKANVTIASFKESHSPDVSLHYCPSWVGSKKKGRPKSGGREKSVTDHVRESGKKSRNRRVRMFCTLCQKFNHDTKDCFKNPLNNMGDNDVDLTVGESNEIIEGEEGAGESNEIIEGEEGAA